jgi:hypothetical protein
MQWTGAFGNVASRANGAVAGGPETGSGSMNGRLACAPTIGVKSRSQMFEGGGAKKR